MSFVDKKITSVIYSFKGKWLSTLSDGSVKVFFRKRAPISMPDKVFLYVGSPVSSIIGYASVKKMERISKSDALAMADDGCISRDELDIYLDNKQDVTAIFIEDYRLFEKPISADEISRFMVFHPPQNFVGLTDDESILIKEMGN